MVVQIIDKSIDNIWSIYDADGSNQLDKKEARIFVQRTLEQMGQSEEYNDHDFD